VSTATWNYWRLKDTEAEIGLHRQAVATVALFALAIESDSDVSLPVPRKSVAGTRTTPPLRARTR
ncbi:MAG: hypothetical protein ACREJT_00940, partial [Myxococcota bacterium]